MIMILDTCGFSRSDEEDGTILQVTGNMTRSMVNGGAPVMVPGGQYRLCWCGSSGSNDNFPNVSSCLSANERLVDMGEMFAIGISPMHSQHRTCTVGVSCTVAGITGHVSVEDGLLVLETCGTESLVEGFHDTPISTVTDQWLTVSWPSVTAQAGQYRLCWCSGQDSTALSNQSAVCQMYSSFRIDVGQLTLTGFSPTARTCISGRTCGFHGISGIGLTGAEEFVVLDTCGTNFQVHRFPGGGFAANFSGSHLDWGSGILSASGGSYRLCACVLGTCNSQVDYPVDIGELVVLGPTTFQDRTCIAGQPCKIESFNGKFLSALDSFAVLETCGTESLVTNFPQELQITQPSGTDDLWGDVTITAAGGQYRLCWCANTGTSCSALEEFQMDVSQFTLIGPNKEMSQTCVSGQTCIIDAPIGQHLTSSDIFQLFDTCGLQSFIPGFPSSVQQVLTRGSLSLDWGVLPITAYGGEYRICWCASGMTCSQADDFKADAGNLLLIGPQPLIQRRTCTGIAAKPCNITGLSGIHLSSLDLVMLLDTCGFPSQRQDPSVGFLGLDVGVTNGKASVAQVEASLYSLKATQLAGGLYRLCWCAAGFSCSSHSDFLTDFGEVYVTGIMPLHQHRTCVSGQTCSWSGINLLPESLTGQQLVVLDTCASNAVRAPLPNSAIVPYLQIEDSSGAAQLEASWGSDRLSGAGGSYRACWCDSDCPNAQGNVFLDLATVSIIGPSPLLQHRSF